MTAYLRGLLGISFALAFIALTAACPEEEIPPAPDGGRDAGMVVDAGGGDAGQADGGEVDAGEVDGGPADAGEADGGEGDGGGNGRLDAITIPQFVEPLVIPPVMPPIVRTAERTDYAIEARPFEQQILPSAFPPTPVFGYGRKGDPLPGEGPSTFNYPAFTLEARTGETVRVEWSNGLTAPDGTFLPHLLPVDQTLHWANPPGPIDMETSDPSPYLGPVPIVTHLHGGHVPSVSDGLPEAWWLPSATNIPETYVPQGTHYGSVVEAPAGSAIFEYPLTQSAATLWYHDHTLGLTRVNVYAGLAGFFLLRDAVEDALGLPGPAPALDEAPGTRHFEIPIVIQDRSFNADGSLFYPSSRAYFDGFTGPFVPDTDVAPIWNPEFFGDTIVVNGRTWPYLEVEPRLYRFRLLNGSGSRFLILALDPAGPAFQQIGSDGGLLPGSPVQRTELLLGPGERLDVLVDFSGQTPGDELVMVNRGPDEPFKGPATSLDPADPATTGRVMLFRVVEGTAAGTPGTVPASLPAIDALTTTLPPRDLTLNEIMYTPADIPMEAELGTAELGPLDWGAEITEDPLDGDTEVWRLLNLTADAHPIHLHLVMFQILDRTPFDAEGYADAQAAFLRGEIGQPVVEDFFTGEPVAPPPEELGWKDTVIANPGEVTRLIARFDLVGLYVWHCHILEHEDNEMMRPFIVRPAP